jgi:hypothetical protein
MQRVHPIHCYNDRMSSNMYQFSQWEIDFSLLICFRTLATSNENRSVGSPVEDITLLMAQSKAISFANRSQSLQNVSGEPRGPVAPLSAINDGVGRSRSYHSALYHVNTRVLHSRTTNLNAVYRSVPAVDGGQKLYPDLYGTGGVWARSRVTLLPPARTLAPSEYTVRYMMKQAAKPNIIGLDSNTILPERTTQRPAKAFLPTVGRPKSRSSSQQDNVSVSGSISGYYTPAAQRTGHRQATGGKQVGINNHNPQWREVWQIIYIVECWKTVIRKADGSLFQTINDIISKVSSELCILLFVYDGGASLIIWSRW